MIVVEKEPRESEALAASRRLTNTRIRTGFGLRKEYRMSEVWTDRCGREARIDAKACGPILRRVGGTSCEELGR